ncbi:MAG TPA: outer membrane protein assembly factor BamE [Thermoanaerobaculia bacterium]|nr:outer membrane protein assembly factor BamE [Thermoanaerobaculia bacterium]
MRSGRAICLLLAALACLSGCGPEPGERQEPGQSEVTVAEWDWLQETRQNLEVQRRRLAQLDAAADPEKPPSEERVRLRAQVDGLAEELNRRLVEYINAHAASGETPGGRQLEAIRMKSDEDILLAREHIRKAGDSRRAIEIYETALAADPENSELKAELEAARARRYVTQERFGQLKEGMTEEEVRSRLGPPNLQDIRGYPERGVTAWFYPKDASGAAAAVWFRDGHAYQLDFNAIQPPSAARPAPARPRSAPAATPAPAPTP